MTTTNFIDKQTVIVAPWLNDVDAHIYNQDLDPHDQYRLKSDLLANNGSSFIQYNEYRTVQEKLGEIVSVKDFGAVGDGDDITSILAQAVEEADHIYFPAGTYTVSGNTIISNKNITLTFAKDAIFDLTGYAGNLFSHVNDYTDIQSVSGITKTTLTLDGSPTSNTALTRVTVEDASAYNRNDILKIISDDIYPDASTSGNRRMGEHTVVAYVDTVNNYVYLSANLYDYSLYTTNIRIAKVGPYSIKIKGLKVNLSLTNSSGTVLSLSASKYPEIECEATGVARILVNAISCYKGLFKIKASGIGYGNGSSYTGNLAYGVNDSGGYGNTIDSPVGIHMRHITTTNQNIVDADSDGICYYGPCMHHTVKNGLSVASQGTPFDEHPGSIFTKWIDCVATASQINNSATGDGPMFNLRGTSASVINPICRAGHKSLLVVNESTKGTISVVGGYSYCPILDNAGLITDITLNISNHISISSAGLICMDGFPGTLNIFGGIISRSALAGTSGYSTITVEDGQNVSVTGTKFVFEAYTTAASSSRIFRPSSTCSNANIRGKFDIECIGDVRSMTYIIAGQGTGLKNIRFYCSASWIGLKPIRVTQNETDFTVNKYHVSYLDDNTGATTYTDIADFLLYSGGL